MSLNEICRSTELSKSSVYREFGGEDGLMLAALERYREVAVVLMAEEIREAGRLALGVLLR